MFVLLEHRTGPAESDVHWDLMVQRPGRETLSTWRLARDPTKGEFPIEATPLAEHRAAYLELEGDIGGGRGRVRRVDRGRCDCEIAAAGAERFVLEGALLRGRFEIVADSSGRVEFRRVR